MRRIFGIAALSGVLLFTMAWTQAAPQKNKAQKGKTPAVSVGNADAIHQEELKEYIYFLASDLLEGRNAPSRGYDVAALYIASHLKDWGVKPGGSQTGTDGPLQPYLMPIELVNSSLDTAGMKLSLVMPAGRGGRGGAGAAGGGRGGAPPAAPAGPRDFEYAKQWTIGAGGGGGRGGGGGTTAAEITGAQLVFVGNGYVINKTNTNPYQGIDVRGKVMIVAGQPAEMVQAMQAQQAAAAAARAGGAGAPAAGGRGGGRGGAANPLGVEGTDFTSPQTYAAKNGALGIIIVPTFQQLSAMAAPAAGGGRGAGLNGPAFQVVKFQAAQQAAVPTIAAGLEFTNALFQGDEKLTAAQVFEGAAANARLESFELNSEKKLSLRIAVNTLKGHTENVVGIIEGSDPVLKNEYVVFSAHLDHVGLSAAGALGDSVNNGADDDGSGSAALMAMARTFAEGAAKGMKPKRSLLFLWVTGEEKGLWGSRYFCQFPPIDITKVVADLNMDMISRSKKPEYKDPPAYKLAEPGEVFVVGPHIGSSDLNTMLESVNAGYLKMKLNDFYDVTAPDATHDNLPEGTTRGQSIFTRSDHYNFARMGIPVAFFTTGLHIDYHQVTDSAEKIDYQQFETITRTVAALGWTVANTATPPKLNAKEKLPEALVTAMNQAKEQGWGKQTSVLPPIPGGKF